MTGCGSTTATCNATDLIVPVPLLLETPASPAMVSNSIHMMPASIKLSHLTLLITGMAIILFSTAGIAHMMGWNANVTDDAAGILPPQQAVPAKSAKAYARRRCPECGVIVSMQKIQDRDDAPVIQTAGGARAGNPDEVSGKLSSRYAITIRMSDGSIRVIENANPPQWRTGERLIVIGAGKSVSP